MLINLVQLNGQTLFVAIVTWMWTGKIVQVAHTQGNQIITLMVWTHLLNSTLGAIAPVETDVVLTKLSSLVFWKQPVTKLNSLSAGKITNFPAKIAATTTLQKNIKTQLKLQKNLWELRKHLQIWETSVCTC
ncbi:hypothetical protein [Fortiea contorta]|uniref:hypothetical protein n=1 Tax=Fortiea contorta TaxID=1892405 RepID=UPI0012B534E0|nr:hypothetical protein [Fortiea contorta]